MDVKKCVITVAGQKQRSLPLQVLIDRDGEEKAVLRILVEEALGAGIETICLVVHPGDEEAYRRVVGEHVGRLHCVAQQEPLGYGHAVHCARDFVGEDAFLHLVGDHLYISRGEAGCARQLVDTARAEECAVSAVQPTREGLLPFFGAVGGRLVAGREDLYVVETVAEKPTPTQAEQQLIVPGLRAGHYLCFFGMHVLTPTVMEMLAAHGAAGWAGVTLSAALDELAGREQYLALEEDAWRYDVGVKYGLLTAQLALALEGRDRDEVMSRLLELLAARTVGPTADGR